MSSSHQPSKGTHLAYLRHTIKLAQKSTPLPTNFRVGCVIVSHAEPSSPRLISSGYTLELPGNTHAEQCALSKLASEHSISEDDLHTILTSAVNATLYTSLEPCGKRLSQNKPCVQRIIDTRRHDERAGIRKVVFGAKEPGTFVQDSKSCQLLTEAGIEWEYISDLEEQILQVAMEGHKKDTSNISQPIQESKVKDAVKPSVEDPIMTGTRIDDISEEEQRRQEAIPRNPKKRMMEVPPESENR